MRRRDAGPVPEAVRRRGEQAGADLRLAAQVRRAAAAAGQRRAALQVRGHHAGRLQEAGESVESSGEPRGEGDVIFTFLSTPVACFFRVALTRVDFETIC